MGSKGCYVINSYLCLLVTVRQSLCPKVQQIYSPTIPYKNSLFSSLRIYKFGSKTIYEVVLLPNASNHRTRAP